MDWYSWLSKTTLNPSQICDYSLALSKNQIEEEDIIYFNHEFLQSIGISIAKHRLHILNLARSHAAPPIPRLLRAIHRTKRCFASLLRNFTRRVGDDSKPLIERKKKLMVAKRYGAGFLLADGSPAAVARFQRFSGPIVRGLRRDDNGGYWGNGVEQIRWDSMFHNLKPT